jgi:hypothetical protein
MAARIFSLLSGRKHQGWKKKIIFWDRANEKWENLLQVVNAANPVSFKLIKGSLAKKADKI